MADDVLVIRSHIRRRIDVLSDAERFYLWCPRQVTFAGTQCRFDSVTATSARRAPVALYNEAGHGLLLELAPHPGDGKVTHMACGWLSAFGGEKERLFLLQQEHDAASLELTDIGEQQYKGMRLFLEALSVLDGCLREGCSWRSTSATRAHFEVIDALVGARRLGMGDEAESESYQRRLFGAFCDDKRAIEVLVPTLRGPFCRLLVAPGKLELFRFDAMSALFPNCRRIKTWYAAKPEYARPSGVTRGWLGALGDMLDQINQNRASRLRRIVVANNHQRVAPVLTSEAIARDFAGVFLSKGWQMTHRECSREMDEIVVARVLQWTAICVERVEVESAEYVVVATSDREAQDQRVTIKYGAFRTLLEQIKAHAKLSKLPKRVRKAFPAKVLFKKQNGVKLMKQRQEKLNVFFRELIAFATEQEAVRMAVMILLTRFLEGQ